MTLCSKSLMIRLSRTKLYRVQIYHHYKRQLWSYESRLVYSLSKSLGIFKVIVMNARFFDAFLHGEKIERRCMCGNHHTSITVFLTNLPKDFPPEKYRS